MTSKIETELLEALDGFKKKAKEDRQDFLSRLKVAIQELPDDAWEGLSKKAQIWVNEAAEAENADKAIAEFPDLVADEDEEEEEKPAPKKKKAAVADDDDEEEEKPKRRAKADDDEPEESEDEVKKPAANTKKTAEKVPAKAKEAEKPAAKKVADKPAAKEKEPKPVKSGKLEGIKVDIKTMVIKKPSLSADEIYEALGGKKAELSKVTIGAVRSETRHTLRVLNQMGKLDIKV